MTANAASANLRLTKRAATSALAGQNLTYTLNLVNQTVDTAANNVVLSDPLPAGTTFVSATQTSGPAATLTTPAVGQNGTVSASWASLGAFRVNSPSNFFPLGNTLYFTASTPSTGVELWKTDGTPQGTMLVKDIFAGTNSSGIVSFCSLGGTLYFIASVPYRGYELWRSDGTAAGTILIKNINPGDADGVSSLASVGGSLYFAGNNGSSGYELWKSDGTAAGTVLVKDINPGSTLSGGRHSFPRNFTYANGTVFFEAQDEINGGELWKTDGTAAGTVLVKDIVPGSAGSFPSNFSAVGDTLFFLANDGVSGLELWKSDGTEAGTVQVKDLKPGPDSPLANQFTNFNGTLFFQARGGETGSELWKSDGTPEGTVLVKDINPGINNSTPASLTVVGNTLFFSASDTLNNIELWKTDGSEAGTVLVKEINTSDGSAYPGSASSNPDSFANVGGTLYFRATDAPATHGQELWKTDGTAAGTILVKDIDPGSVGSYPTNLANFNGTLFFQAHDNIGGNELWKSDGTAAGTVPLRTEEEVNLQIVVKIASDTVGTLSNTATVTSSTDDPYLVDNTSTATTVVPDNTKPVPGISTPTNLQSLSISAFNSITGSATDNVGVTDVLLKLFRNDDGVVQYWNGSSFTTTPVLVAATLASPGNSSTTWSYPVSPELKAALEPDSYLVYAYARDAAGNQSSAASRNFVLTNDDAKPVPVISTPTAGQTLSLAEFTNISGSATDNVGVTQVLLKLFRVRGGVIQYWNGTAFTPTATTFPTTLQSPDSPSTLWSYSVPPALQSALDNGSYEVFAYGRDAAGNQSAAVSRKFTITGVPSAQSS